MWIDVLALLNLSVDSLAHKQLIKGWCRFLQRHRFFWGRCDTAHPRAPPSLENAHPHDQTCSPQTAGHQALAHTPWATPAASGAMCQNLPTLITQKKAAFRLHWRFFIRGALIELRQWLHISFCFTISAHSPSKHISYPLLQFQRKANPSSLNHFLMPTAPTGSLSKMAGKSFSLSQHSLYSTLTLCPLCFYSGIQIEQQLKTNKLLFEYSEAKDFGII